MFLFSDRYFSLTQLCRAKFAETGRAEDMVYSSGERGLIPPDTTDEREPVVHSKATTLGGLFPYGSTRFWTWKHPPGPRFSYTSVPARPHHVARRGANPFGPNSNVTGVPSVEKPERLLQSSIPGEITDSKVSSRKNGAEAADTESDHPKGQPSSLESSRIPLARRNTAATRRSVKPSVVTPHATYPAWDDFPDLNRPYENPFYVTHINNFLWLPRNPFGVLDLDDSVDMHQSLTSEPGAGKLGQWMSGTVESPMSFTRDLADTPSSMTSPESNHSESVREFPFRMGRRLSGTEEISLSPILASRVGRIEKEDDVDRARLHSSTLGRSRGSEPRMSSARRPSTLDGRPSSLAQSASHSPAGPPGRSVSGLSSGLQSQITPQRLLRSTTYDPVNEPDLQAQAVFIESSLSVPMSMHLSRGSRLSNRRERSAGPPVQVRDAVVGEVIAEEQVEAMDRIRREEEERRLKETQRPCWWNAWFWHRSTPAVHPGAQPDTT